jgi:hypothetical protein
MLSHQGGYGKPFLYIWMNRNIIDFKDVPVINEANDQSGKY